LVPIIGAGFFLGLLDDTGNAQEPAKASDVGGPIAIGKQSVVANAVETLGEDVHEEAAYELVGVQCHGLPPFGSVDTVVLPALCRARHSAGYAAL
jgi:hypothetical protein